MPPETREALFEAIREGHAARVAREEAESERPLERRAQWEGSAIFFYFARPGSPHGRIQGRSVERSHAVLYVRRAAYGRLPPHEYRLIMRRWVRTGELPKGAEIVEW